MTYEEMERTMQFIVEQQAKFFGDIERINGTIDKHTQAIAGLIQISGTLVEQQRGTQAHLDELSSDLRRLDRTMEDLARVQIDLAGKHAAFVSYVEKYIRSRDGGKT